ncbi:amidase [Acuticoccus mangrovi]|uniref:Indoleacetamide hydrolase n=1 Tax=Acuticoccus mangrovi TaxID=2796142 RepID=A0A934IGS8_9HYPH|nr:amidase [Acuticoccus mangrovi]MBJ3776178.1 amidase [Acuticoccus mangrovi]
MTSTPIDGPADADLSAADATHLLAAFGAGSDDPVAALARAEARLAAIDPRINAMTVMNPAARADAKASAARWRAGSPVGPLDGVPITLKDNLVAAGMSASFGTPALAERIAAHDELPVARLRAAGAVFLGKTNVPEFCLEGYTANSVYGATGNPHAPDLTPGGSSGGAAASVAAGVVPVGIGTDGGGSLRRPAGHTGLVTLKSTPHHYARAAGLPVLYLDFEVVGALCRSLADLILFDRVLSAREPAPERRHPWRVRYVERLGDAPLDPVIAATCRTAVEGLAAAGWRIEEGPLPLDTDPIIEVWRDISAIGLAHAFAADPEMAARATERYRALAAEAAALPATHLYEIVTRVRLLREAARETFADVDLLITPATAAQPWPKAEAFPPVIDGHAVGPRGHAVYTGWVNAAGLPALAVPLPAPAGSLPIGLQIIAGTGREDRLLGVGKALLEAGVTALRG